VHIRTFISLPCKQMRVTWVSGDDEPQYVVYSKDNTSVKSSVTTFQQSDMCGMHPHNIGYEISIMSSIRVRMIMSLHFRIVVIGGHSNLN